MDEIDKLHVRMQGRRHQDVADMARMSRATLSKILNRKGDFKMSTVTRINAALSKMGAKIV